MDEWIDHLPFGSPVDAWPQQEAALGSDHPSTLLTIGGMSVLFDAMGDSVRTNDKLAGLKSNGLHDHPPVVY